MRCLLTVLLALQHKQLGPLPAACWLSYGACHCETRAGRYSLL